jgi:hypothetical protein
MLQATDTLAVQNRLEPLTLGQPNSIDFVIDCLSAVIAVVLQLGYMDRELITNSRGRWQGPVRQKLFQYGLRHPATELAANRQSPSRGVLKRGRFVTKGPNL